MLDKYTKRLEEEIKNKDKLIKRLGNMLNDKDKEVERLNNIINELEKDLEDRYYGRGKYYMDSDVIGIKDVLNYIKKLKENKNVIKERDTREQ